MRGYSTSYASETIALRGYENGSLTPYGSEGYAYVRLGAELRYPLMLENSTSIYALGFIEGGNAWTDVSKFNPFQLKRSAGVGVRIFLPMIGMMGIDWAYGFDKINGSSQYSGSQFHFILGHHRGNIYSLVCRVGRVRQSRIGFAGGQGESDYRGRESRDIP